MYVTLYIRVHTKMQKQSGIRSHIDMAIKTHGGNAADEA